MYNNAMQQIVSITSQGQLTIPKSFLKELGIKKSAKAVLVKKGDIIEVHPKKDFWSLSGSMKSGISLSENDLKKARREFSENWGNE